MPHDESYALQVLAAILSQGKSSRLHRSLVHEKRLALQAGAEYNPAAMDPAMITIWATPLQGIAASEVEQAVYAEIEALKENPPTPREIRKAKNQITASFVFSLDSPHSEAAQIALFEMACGWQLMSKYADNINAVTATQVQALAAKYLTTANRTVATLTPTEKPQKP
jgi:zinc protease